MAERESNFPRTAAGPERARLGLVEAVRSNFGFVLEAGYIEVSAEPTYVRFERVDAFVVVFHGRASYELGIELGRWVWFHGEEVEEKFHGSDVWRELDLRPFPARTAVSPDQVDRFVREVAAWTREAVVAIGDEGSAVFDRLRERGRRDTKSYLERDRARRLRLSVDDAWRRRDFATVVEAYEEVDNELSTVQLKPSEAKRLAIARKYLDERAG